MLIKKMIWKKDYKSIVHNFYLQYFLSILLLLIYDGIQNRGAPDSQIPNTITYTSWP